MKLVYTVTRNFDEAKKIGEFLVQSRLAACVNIIDGMQSIYWWGENIEYDKESILLVKTKKTLVKQVMAQIKAMHGYEAPAIFSLDVDKIDATYMKWLKSSTKLPRKRKK